MSVVTVFCQYIRLRKGVKAIWQVASPKSSEDLMQSSPTAHKSEVGKFLELLERAETEIDKDRGEIGKMECRTKFILRRTLQ